MPSGKKLLIHKSHQCISFLAKIDLPFSFCHFVVLSSALKKYFVHILLLLSVEELVWPSCFAITETWNFLKFTLPFRILTDSLRSQL